MTPMGSAWGWEYFPRPLPPPHPPLWKNTSNMHRYAYIVDRECEKPTYRADKQEIEQTERDRTETDSDRQRQVEKDRNTKTNTIQLIDTASASTNYTNDT